VARRKRLDPAVFALPVQEIRAGRYTDKYFTRAREVLERDGRAPRVHLQVFGKSEAWLGGADEAIALLELCARDFRALRVCALHDGDAIAPWETVLTIEGPYPAFAELETLLLGILARRTRVLTQTRRAVLAARGKDVLFFPARFDHFSMQPGDGYAAHVAGAAGVSTDAQGEWWGGTGLGTVPHALIAAYGGDTVLATRKLAEHMPESVRIVSLVDFENDCVGTSLAVARALGPRLHGVRLDTSERLVDASLAGDPEAEPGVCAALVRKVRQALDAEGFSHVRIVVSGGFTPEKIDAFERAGVPADAYGVGSSLLRGSFDFTADVVEVEGRPCAKQGRERRPNPRLERVE
jgi:nicotinate phosphoribosyltransferase